MQEKAKAHKAAGGLRKRLNKAIHHEESAQKEYHGLDKAVENFNKKTGGKFLKHAPKTVSEIKHEEGIHEHEFKEIEHALP